MLGVLLENTHVNKKNLLVCIFFYDTLEAVRDKDSTAITITLPRALDDAVQELADKSYCGNKSAAIRHVLYKEAGVLHQLRLTDEDGEGALSQAERRAVKYGRRPNKRKRK
jgi:predicted transcriptional regulator